MLIRGAPHRRKIKLTIRYRLRGKDASNVKTNDLRMLQELPLWLSSLLWYNHLHTVRWRIHFSPHKNNSLEKNTHPLCHIVLRDTRAL